MRPVLFWLSRMSGNLLDPIMTNRYYIIQASHAGTPMTADKTIF